MMNSIRKFIAQFKKERNQTQEQEKEQRKILINKVEKGTDLVIREYGDALRKLGAYDRQ